MKTRELHRALRRHRDTQPVFKGVYPCNRLPTVPPGKVMAIIANTDPSHKPGQHWVAYFYTKTHVFYFDSYGQPPLKPTLRKMMSYRRHKKHFGRRLQGSGHMCGEYCLFFILAMLYNWDFDCFGDNLDANDRYVWKTVRRHFFM